MTVTPRGAPVMRHKWIVWLYTSAGHTLYGPGTPIRKGQVVTSRRRAKQLAMTHAAREPGNEGVICRWSHNVRGRGAESPYVHFSDLITTHYSVDGRELRVSRVVCDFTPLDFALLLKDRFSRTRYAAVVANPHVIGERHSAVFRSVTKWQAEDYIVEVKAGYFWTREEAEEFGRQRMRLELYTYGVGLLDSTGKPLEVLAPYGEWLDWIDDEDVRVMRLRSSSREKFVVSIDDYDLVPIATEDFKNLPDLGSFESLSYGVFEYGVFESASVTGQHPGPSEERCDRAHNSTVAATH